MQQELLNNEVDSDSSLDNQDNQNSETIQQKEFTKQPRKPDTQEFLKMKQLYQEWLRDLGNEEKAQEMKVYYQQNKVEINFSKLHNQIYRSNEFRNFLKENLFLILDRIQISKLGKVFYKYLFKFIKRDKKLNLDYDQISTKTKTYLQFIQLDLIKLFTEAFHLEFSQEEWIQYYEDLIKKKNYDFAFQFYQHKGFGEEEFVKLINAMNNKTLCTKAGQFINKLELDPHNYPQILEQQQRKSAYYLYKNYSIDKCEEMLQHDKGILVQIIYFLHDNNQEIQAVSIIERQQLLNLITQEDIQIYYKKMIEQIHNKEIQALGNIIFDQDFFGPSDKLFNNSINYLTCKDLGFDQQQIKIIDKFDQQYELAWKDILNSEYVGIDTEFSYGKTNLELQKQALLLIQIATKENAYLFDFPQLRENKLLSQHLQQLLYSQILKIGHTIKEDLSIILKEIGIHELNENPQVIPQVYDISIIFKNLKLVESKQISLAFITQQILQKPLSKLEQMSDWRQRPLRLAQIHYGALDAIVCLRIYEILYWKYGTLEKYNVKEKNQKQKRVQLKEQEQNEQQLNNKDEELIQQQNTEIEQQHNEQIQEEVINQQ